ncbi:hypothetical protein [Pseudoroseomonas cervicalis]|uniref:hypothetical protein n=1 Tax=Teichococcus cervicalis TaxID=204525 RepID=UPI0022F1A75E|nr:hypothetical protein [Pseudoroseomonas cervicalis]WBV42091.1 hypothetical protein PFY06_12710 [Pseudoroseomonas cervicalis]
MRRRAALLALLAAPLLSGCELAGGIAGGVTGGVTGTLSGNAAVGYAVGVGVRAATDAAVDAWLRRLQRAEQTAIAEAAGSLAPGERRPWRVSHGLPFGWRDNMGQLEVTREIDTPLAQCREVLFSVQDKPEAPPEGVFLATACRQSGGWRWAGAEPSVSRWRYLQ